MFATVTSDLDRINRALEDINPFLQPPILRGQHVWNEDFPDIESLNSHASDAVFKALDEIRLGHYSTTSIVISAQNGTGKTHIIKRIRNRLKKQGGALFVLANKFPDIDNIQNGFQDLLAKSLNHTGSKGVTQWQELAADISNYALKSQKPNAKPLKPQELIERFENSDEEKVRTWITRLTKAFCRVKSVQDPEIVKAILWNLSPDQSAFATNWLAGMELAQYKANELRLPPQRQSFDTTLQILELISNFNELVVCFDELEGDEIGPNSGLRLSQAVAYFVKQLFDHLSRGVILTALHPGDWHDDIKSALPGAVAERMSAQGKPYELRHMDSESVTELISKSLNSYYKDKGLVPPHPLYPFNENQIHELGRERTTVRAVLKWCKENCKPQSICDTADEPKINQHDESVDSNPDLKEENHSVEEAFRIESRDDLEYFWEDNHLIGNALLFSLKRLIGKTVEGVEIVEVTNRVDKRGRADKYLNFKILGQENSSTICIGVAVLQYDGGKALGAGLKRLLDQKGEYELTRGCLVRSKEKHLNRHFRNKYITSLIKEKGGEFVDLKPEEIQPLIAIYDVYRKREEHSLTEEQIFEFIENVDPDKLLGVHNPLIQEILSAPSYEVPETQDEPETDSDQVEDIDSEALIDSDDDSSLDLDAVSGSDPEDTSDLLEDDDDMLSSGSTGLTDLIIEDE